MKPIYNLILQLSRLPYQVKDKIEDEEIEEIRKIFELQMVLEYNLLWDMKRNRWVKMVYKK